MEIVWLADRVKDAVCVRARFGVQEGEDAFVCGCDGIETESGDKGWS